MRNNTVYTLAGTVSCLRRWETVFFSDMARF